MIGFFAGGCASLRIKEAAERGDVGFLMETLKNRKSDHASDAALALIEVGAPAVEPLIAVVKDSSVHWFSRGYAARALGEIGDTRAVEPLIAVLKDDQWEASVRRDAASALGEIGDARAVEALVSALNRENENMEVRTYSAIALGKVGDIRAVQPLITTMKTAKRQREALGVEIGRHTSKYGADFIEKQGPQVQVTILG
jgi:HEAT repeat protein